MSIICLGHNILLIGIFSSTTWTVAWHIEGIGVESNFYGKNTIIIIYPKIKEKQRKSFLNLRKIYSGLTLMSCSVFWPFLHSSKLGGIHCVHPSLPQGPKQIILGWRYKLPVFVSLQSLKSITLSIWTKQRLVVISHNQPRIICGKRGIRTPGASQHAGFQDRCNRPLYHLSRLPFERPFFRKALQRYE